MGIVNFLNRTMDLFSFNKKMSKLLAERDGLLSERTGLLSERDAFLSERTDLLSERDAFLSERTDLLSERDAFLAERTDLQQQILQLRSDRRELLRPLDGGFFRFSGGEIDVDAIARLLDGGEATAAMLEFLASVRVRVAQAVGDDYLKPFMNYYVACMYANICMEDKAIPYIEKIDFTAPSDGADFLPYDLRQITRLAYYRQHDAILRNVPSVAVFGLQRSASSYLSTLLSDELDAPVLRLCVGEGMSSLPVPGWVEQFARGGAVTHEHMRGTHYSADWGIMPWIQIRDPREAAYSLMVMSQPPGSGQRSLSFQQLCGYVSQWIAEWQSHDVNFIFYEDIVNNPAGTLKKMLGYSPKTLSGSVKAKTALGGNWRQLPGDIREQAWDAIPASVKSLMNLSP